ncbi:TetR family transcriptional regulator [Streptomyces sp. NPDC091281]|uniref:TetR family transcriptional regulator n=1 Tax=Streptomyces sp. NPDC091281 TaxID=3365985 RepID=UPI0037FF66FB
MSASDRGTSAGPAAAKPSMRDALVAAAFTLFLERGYEQTTVDDIVALAGVGRRSFFRYFPSKEDVVFPDHERCLADMTAFLAVSDPTAEPVRRVCDAARLVLRMYAENPSFSVQRYGLTRQVPGLRAYELSVVWRYERALAGYLRARFADLPGGALRADVVAAAVVAAHNNALRSWLRSAGRDDPSTTVDHALAYVQAAFADPAGASAELPRGPHEFMDPGDPGAQYEPGDPGDPRDVVVVVSRRGAPLWRVVQEVETAFGRTPGGGR